MRTEIATIGKTALLDTLFENTEYHNTPVLQLSEKGESCSAHRILTEGIDFDLVYTPLKHLGYKAVLYVVGEIYAAFHNPCALSVQLGISSKFCVEDIRELFDGILAASREHHITQLSLDMNPSLNGLCISLAAIGLQKKGVRAQRAPYKNMDLICLSGRLGAAYMGLHVLEREKVAFNKDGRQPDLSKYSKILASYLSPEINPETVSRFLADEIYPSGGYFVTHGLADAVLQLTRDSGFGAKIYLEKIPMSHQTNEAAEEFGIDPVTAAMNGGDDFQFIFTVPIGKNDIIRRNFQDYDVIGHLARPEVGAVLVTPEGAEIQLRSQAYESAEESEQ